MRVRVCAPKSIEPIWRSLHARTLEHCGSGAVRASRRCDRDARLLRGPSRLEGNRIRRKSPPSGTTLSDGRQGARRRAIMHRCALDHGRGLSASAEHLEELHDRRADPIEDGSQRANRNQCVDIGRSRELVHVHRATGVVCGTRFRRLYRISHGQVCQRRMCLGLEPDQLTD